MDLPEKMRLALRRAEERHAQSERQLEEIKAEVERRWTEYTEAQQAYVRTLERELAERPDPAAEKRPAEDTGWDEPGSDFRDLVLQAGSYGSGNRVVAQRALDRMGPRAIEPLLGMLAKETYHWERRIHVTCAVLVTLIVAEPSNSP